MRSFFDVRRAMALLLVALLAGVPNVAGTQEKGPAEEQLRRELDAVKEQLRRVEQQMKQQEEVIRRLSGEKPSVPAVPPRVAAPPTAPPAVPVVDEDALRLKILEEVQRAIQPQLSAANKTFASQFNPAIGFIMDNVLSYSRKDNANFEFRSAELGISASVDPFARAYAIITGTPEGIEVDEAAIVTTALPYNLTVKGGRFFADFGRLSKFHDHDLPFVNRPIVLDSYIGGEGQADGVEVSWLAPLSQYLALSLGAYNKVGADNDRADNLTPREFSEFTYLGRATTFFSLNDANSIDLGVSAAVTPEVKVDGGDNRSLVGLDVTYRYTPLAQASYRGLVWGTEILVNHEARPVEGGEDEESPAAFKYRDAFGMYSYLEARLSRRYRAGFLFEYAEDIDHPSQTTRAYSPYLTLWASDFHRLRLQYTHLDAPDRTDDQFFLQWTIVMGSHVHSFRDR